MCHECFNQYLVGKVSEGVIDFKCSSTQHSSRICKVEIASILPNRELAREFLKFLVAANSGFEPTVKTCPRCSVEYTADEATLEWFFTRHAPWHECLMCKEYRDEVLLGKWARGRDKFHRNQTDAQRFPKCKVGWC